MASGLASMAAVAVMSTLLSACSLLAPRPPDDLPSDPAAGAAPRRPSPRAAALDTHRNDGRDVEAILAETSTWLTELAPLNGDAAHRRVAELLVNFSALVGRLDPPDATRAAAKKITEEAQALVTDPGWFGYTDRTRDGLLACADALVHVARASSSPKLEAWARAAEASARAIRAEDPFGIQRIAIQDALRAAADALRAAATERASTEDGPEIGERSP